MIATWEAVATENLETLWTVVNRRLGDIKKSHGHAILHLDLPVLVVTHRSLRQILEEHG